MKPLRVIERTGRAKVRWTDEQKAAIVEESLEGRNTVAEVGRRHGIHSSVLFRWRKAYRAGQLGPDSRQPGFTEAVIKADNAQPCLAPPVKQSPLPVQLGASMEVIALSGRRVVVGPDVDGVALARVLAVLEGA